MFHLSHSWSGIWKKDMGRILGDWRQTSFAQGQSRRMWIVVSRDWHLGHHKSTDDCPNARKVLGGRWSHRAFQRKSWIFLGHEEAHIQFHRALSHGASWRWKRNVVADLMEHVPLLWGQRKESSRLATEVTGIPWISSWIWGGRGRLMESKLQVWLSHRKLTRRSSSWEVKGP